jgi:hypothetical protein
MEETMIRTTGVEVKRRGGKWLGAIRTWIQSHKCCGNGETIIWGSDEEVKPAMTMREVEEICGVAVASIINDPEQIDKPMPSTIQQNIILYAKGWYGRSGNIIDDLCKILSELTAVTYEYYSKADAMELLIHTFEEYVNENQRIDAMKHCFVYPTNDLLHLEMEQAMIGKLSIVSGRYVDLKETIPVWCGNGDLADIKEKERIAKLREERLKEEKEAVSEKSVS